MQQPYEKLGVFYLGRINDPAAGATTPEYLLYDAKDLTTHALCVGMTGSGKTGLCISLLEEAGMDAIPAIVVDPKGDIGNLMLTFPQLRPHDFLPWIDETEAARRGLSPDEYARQVAAQWRDGLAQWDQDGARIGRFRDSVELAIYTPGSSAGRPITVLRSFAAPSQKIIDDTDAFRDRVASATSGLLALLGIDADPVQSREFILISNLLDRAWRSHRDMDIASLIREIQKPPFAKIGVMDVDVFFPLKDRTALSMTLNSLLASPSFASWLEGEPLDIQRLLYAPSGKPRISILSIAHLSDAERMFFVTILLNELLTWVRGQAGTPSLRALFYMDEVFGYFPPVANPPSKQPMLTLLKQARAFGLGLVLATQNPVDLDYKGLSNCGTWFLGRLQTERDKARVLDGLEGANAQAGARFDRQRMDAILSGLAGRTFLMNNVHDDQPVVFTTRWAMSYLRGPLTRDQIRALTARQTAESEEEIVKAADAPLEQEATLDTEPVGSAPDPQIPPDVPQCFLTRRKAQPAASKLIYRPSLLGTGRLHFVRATYHVDHWEQRQLLVAVGDSLVDPVWERADSVGQPLSVQSTPEAAAGFASLPPELTLAKSYGRWQKELINTLYRTQTLEVFKCTELKVYSEPGESETDFRVRLGQLAREERDHEVEKLRDRYASKAQSLKDRIRRAQEQVDREKSDYRHKSMDTAISVGASIFGALFGRKKLSRSNVERASSSARRVGRVARERQDVERAEENLDALLQQQAELEQALQDDVAKIDGAYRADKLDLQRLTVRPRKSDIVTQPIALAWTPWYVDAAGKAVPAS